MLDASRELFTNELNYVRNYESSLASVIELYRALAADWMPEPSQVGDPPSGGSD